MLKKTNDSSSQNQLFESNSHIFKDKLNNNSLSASHDLLKNSKSNSNSNNSFNKNIIKINKNNSIKNINEDQEIIQELILKDSKRNKIFIIEIYCLIIVFLLIISMAYSIYKIIITLKYNKVLDNFFKNYTTLSNRYNILYYFFNIFNTLLITPEDEKKEQLKQQMEIMNTYFESQNSQFNNFLLNQINEYKETKKLIDIVKYNNEGAKDIIKENICLDESVCLDYLNSDYFIFDSGIDFIFRTCIIQLNNLYMEYQKIKNKNDINEIKSIITKGKYNQYSSIELSINHLFYFVKERIFESFRTDQLNIRQKYMNIISLLNIISIIFSLLSFLFINIFIFISLYTFSEPIKESTYRINLSYFHIKKYNIKKCTV